MRDRLVQLLRPSVTLIDADDPRKKIELAGRTCYKSEDVITSDSSVQFVDKMVQHKHLAMTEHATFTFLLTSDYPEDADAKDTFGMYLAELLADPFINVTFAPTDDAACIVSTNLRRVIERGVLDPIAECINREYPRLLPDTLNRFDDTNYSGVSCDLLDMKHNYDSFTTADIRNHVYLTLKFICDRGVSHELVRHRRFSFAQESTRYCNYANAKFGSTLTFIEPAGYDEWPANVRSNFEKSLKRNESAYMLGIQSGMSAQQARAMLPNALKTEIVVTGNIEEWLHFIDLRSLGVTGPPHPDMKVVADMAKDIIYAELSKYSKGQGLLNS